MAIEFYFAAVPLLPRVEEKIGVCIKRGDEFLCSRYVTLGLGLEFKRN
jgi:hypothetical protein